MHNPIDYRRFRAVCSLRGVNVAAVARVVGLTERHCFSQLAGAAALTSATLEALRQVIGDADMAYVTGKSDILAAPSDEAAQ